MAAVSILLLAVGVAGAIARPFRLPAWAAPVLCAGIDLVVGGITVDGARRALHPLAEPIGFLLAAVPLALLLDRLGCFRELADLMTRRGRATGRLWVLGALVTTVLNLDAAVVLLTPLYVTVARRSGRRPVALAFQPVLLALVASSALPVSNLTNLIAVSWTGATTLGFVTHLAAPSMVATAVGWWRYRRVLDPERVQPVAAAHGEAGAPDRDPAWGPDRSADPVRRPPPVGGAVVGVVLIGFVAGRSVGVPPWAVALAADVVLLAMVRWAPWRTIPWGTALVAGSLGVLAAGAVVHHPVHRPIGGHGVVALARTTAVGGAAANLVNNLPALLVALPAVGHHPGPVHWAVLLGVNMGPVGLVTGSLSSLLCMDAVGHLGVSVTAREFSRVGLLVGLPATLAGAAVLVVMLAITGS